jgi:hypothetical protein
MHYNFVRIHQTLRVTPAMAAGDDQAALGFDRHGTGDRGLGGGSIGEGRRSASLVRGNAMRFVLAINALVLISRPAFADDPIGRYQAIAIPPASNSISSGNILLLDTRDGHVWEWWHAATIGNVAGGAGITYMGKLISGKAPGEVVQRFRYGQ